MARAQFRCPYCTKVYGWAEMTVSGGVTLESFKLTVICPNRRCEGRIPVRNAEEVKP